MIIVIALVLAAAVYVAIMRLEPLPGPLGPATEAFIPAPLKSVPESESESIQEALPAEASDAQTVEPIEIEDTVINIGEPMDPYDPFTWPKSANTEVINIGEPMDPDDPSTWPQSDNTEVINIGEPMDPDDPSTWPQPGNTEVINIGEPMDPDNPYTRPQSNNTEVINIGEPMAPDDPYTWPR